MIDFTQGLDIRCLTDADIEILNDMRLKNVHFAWDDPNIDLSDRFRKYAGQAKHKFRGAFGTVYCLTNFNSTIEQDLYRIYTLRDLGFDPYVMIYAKYSADKVHRDLQRWCNGRQIFRTCPDFNDYKKLKTDKRQYLLEVQQ